MILLLRMKPMNALEIKKILLNSLKVLNCVFKHLWIANACCQLHLNYSAQYVQHLGQRHGAGLARV